jgi:hypothetical protein
MVMVGLMTTAMRTCAECATHVTLGAQGSRVQQHVTLADHRDLE